MSSFEEAEARLLERIEMLGEVTDTPGALTRTFLSRANQEAAALVASWMKGAGMRVGHDAGGTIRGVLGANIERRTPNIEHRSERQREEGDAARPLLLGSHIDTVIDAGKYDGALGVLIAIAALEVTGPLAFPVHVLGFSDEEGVRFQATYLGSRACVGALGAEMLEMRDAEGISLEEALERARAGKLREGEGRPTQNIERRRSPVEGVQVEASVPAVVSAELEHPLSGIRLEEFRYGPGECRGYVEVHIEQARVLEEAGEAVGVVSAISGQSRLKITIRGQADHAGTTPMHLRKDALTGAAECVLAVERLARDSANAAAGLMATVGKLEVSPGAGNVIPGEVRFALDFRHPDDGERERLLEGLLGQFGDIAAARGLEAFAKTMQSNAAVPCDAALTARLLDAAEPLTGKRRLLPSGAGHDGVMMATAMPIAMLFVRCRAGLSHHPDEYASPEDVGAALKVLVEFLRGVG